MARTTLLPRAGLVDAGVRRLGLTGFWQSAVAARALAERSPASAAILADLPEHVADASTRERGDEGIDESTDGNTGQTAGGPGSPGARAAGAPADQAAAAPGDVLRGLTIGEIAVLYEYSLARVDSTSRKSAGQFFTPDDVSRFLAERGTRLGAGTWLDPCCGVGNLSYWLAAAHPDPRAFVARDLVLVDLDPLALSIAVTLLAVAFGLDEDEYRAFASRARVADALADPLPDVDFVIMNPPYVVVLRDARFSASADARDLYAYFLERMIGLARHGVVAITPQSFVFGSKFAGLRDLMRQRFTAMDLYCFDNVPDNIFRGVKFGSSNSNVANSTRAAVLVGTLTPADEVRHRITPILRWRTPQRARMLAEADDFLTDLREGPGGVFPKLSRELAPLHDELIADGRTIGGILSRTTTEHHLDVPFSLRYFMSAIRAPQTREHSYRLHFTSEADLERAWLVLNSSLTYWWWRTYQGGITISRALLATVPLPVDRAPEELVALLHRSERSNLITKLNAGHLTENVKHPREVLMRLNAAVAPRYADALLATHSNSVFDLGQLDEQDA